MNVFTREIDLSNVQNVVEDFRRNGTLQRTLNFILEKDRIRVRYVERIFRGKNIWLCIRDFTADRILTSVRIVVPDS